MKIELFVNGRLCLFGEHSDWAGQYRRFNSSIVAGEAVVCGTREGIAARAGRAAGLEVRTVLPGGEVKEFSCAMEPEVLLKVAGEGGFFSYIAGVAAHFLTFYEIGGINLDIYEMTLPLKKGLSSSAAVCVLTARAFSALYGLNLSTRGEMEAAYHGEQLTPSRCGRLDQACAYGRTPVRLRFDGDRLDAAPLHVGAPLYWVFADLNGRKDTVRILRDLNSAYPYPGGERDEQLHRLLGEENRAVVDDVARAMAEGDARGVGELMTKAQRRFDEVAAPFSPEELKGERLHAVLADEQVRQLSYGGKGVGSQGDGCVQFIARDEAAQAALVERLRELGCEPFSMTLERSRLVRRAVVPVAGFGTRMYPATKVVQKELLPVPSADGGVKPALLVLLQELHAAGIERVALIVRPGTKAVYEALFRPLGEAHLTKLSPQMQAAEREICALGQNIEYIEQHEQLGFGHAVLQSRAFAGGEPVLLCLGDHIYASKADKSCTRQLIDCYEAHQRLAVSVAETPLDTVGLYGIVHGSWEDARARQILHIDRFEEKPTQQLAREELGVFCRTVKKYFALFGQYVLTPEVYDELARAVAVGRTERGEYQLTSALETVRAHSGAVGCRVEGRRFDIGVPEQYIRTFTELGAGNGEKFTG